MKVVERIFKHRIHSTQKSQKSLLLSDKRAESSSNLQRIVPTLVYIQDVLKVKVEVKVHVIWALCYFTKKSFFSPRKWLDCE